MMGNYDVVLDDVQEEDLVEEVEEVEEISDDELYGKDESEEENIAFTTDDEEINEKSGKVVPLAKLIELKGQLKELKKENYKYRVQEEEKGKASRIDRIRKIALERGVDDDSADIFAEIASELYKAIPETDMETLEISDEVDDFIETTPSAKKLKKEIVERLKKFRKVDADFTPEEAYRSIKPTKTDRELGLESEQKELLQKRSIAKGDKEPPATSSASMKAKYPLTPDEKRIIAGLQRVHPDSGWNAEKYYKVVKKRK
jgi:hypothetical protein